MELVITVLGWICFAGLGGVAGTYFAFFMSWLFSSERKRPKYDPKLRERIMALTEGGNYGLCPPPMDASVAIEELKNYFLGEDWYIVMPINDRQANTEIVYAIESRYYGWRKPEDKLFYRIGQWFIRKSKGES